MSSGEIAQKPGAPSSMADTPPARAPVPIWRRAIPYLGTAIIFVLIFWRIPVGKVVEALRRVPALEFIGIFLPFAVVYFAFDSFCLTWVVRRFNAKLRFAEVMPIRASMYLLALLNTSLGQGGVAYYLYRRARIPFFEALSSVLFIAVLEIYQLFLFSTLGVLFYAPANPRLLEVTHALRIAYVVAWALLFALIGFFALARRNAGLREGIESSRFGPVLSTFLKARAARLSDRARDQGADVPGLDSRAVLRALAVWHRDSVPEAGALSAAGLPGRGPADRDCPSRHQPGGVAAVLFGQRLAADDSRLQPGGALHLHVVQRTRRPILSAPRDPRADESSRRKPKRQSGPNTGKPSRSAASARRRSSVTNSSVEGSPSAATRAAPSCSASAARRG